MDRPFEHVYTVTDYCDGPRGGVADFDGAPHVYRSVYLDTDERDPDEDRFELRPVAPDVLELALEDWAIWRRWEEEYYAGRAELTGHPALPPDRTRHEELAPVIALALDLNPLRCWVAIGEFRTRNGVRGGPGIPTSRAELEVRWTPVT